MSNDLPLVTIGILSWNRLRYFRATVESARLQGEGPRKIPVRSLHAAPIGNGTLLPNPLTR